MLLLKVAWLLFLRQLHHMLLIFRIITEIKLKVNLYCS